MPALPIMITDAGLDAIANAQSGATDAVIIAAIGLTAAPFVMAPTIEALPGEFRRIATVAGQAVAENILHVTAYDADAIAYDVTGFGLYSADDVLLAVYSEEADPLLSKAALATSLFAIDISIAADIAAVIEFGDPQFLNPPATEAVAGVAKLATDALADGGVDHAAIMTAKQVKRRIDAIPNAAEATRGLARLGTDALADAGVDHTTIMTPRLVKRVLDAVATAFTGVTNAISNALNALLARTITGAGLATGGGDLTASRVITVPKATGAIVTTGTDDTMAITALALAQAMGARSLGSIGYVTLFGFIVQWGTYSVGPNASVSPSFPTSFPTNCVHAGCSGGRQDYGAQDNNPFVSGTTTNSLTIFNSADSGTINSTWFAIGY
ncbi:MAG TPA: hypothetical protein VEZ59_09100 [Sphingopyxis sp.]|nr:hypothetical protein [Sphingopyxis sp.]